MEPTPPALDLYVAWNREGGIETVNRGDLLLATNDPIAAMAMEAKFGVSKIYNIPPEAVVRIRDTGAEGWEPPIRGIDPDEIVDYMQNSGSFDFQVRLFPYRDILYIDDNESEDTDAE